MFTEIELVNARCFERARIPLHPRVTVLIGENGSGKSTVAQAVASLAWGPTEGLAAFPLRWGEERGAIRLIAGSEARAAWSSEDRKRLRMDPRPWVLVYGRYRGIALAPGVGAVAAYDVPVEEIWRSEEWGRPRRRRDLEGDRSTTIVRPDEDLLAARTDLLVEIEANAAAVPRLGRTWERLAEWLMGLDEGLQEVRVDDRGGREELVIVRRGQALTLDEIADGYKSVLSVVFDLLARFAYADAGDDPLATEGFVVIDEVDLHLHPRWQRAVVSQLADLFPNVQFLLTTHSPVGVQGAIDEGFGVVLLSDEGERVRPLDDAAREELRNVELGAVVVNEGTFGVRSRYSPAIEEKEREVEALRRKVQRDEATDAERGRLVDLLDELQQLLARDERLRGREVLLSELAATQVALLKKLEAAS